MNAKRLVTVALVALLLLGGVAAATPAGQTASQAANEAAASDGHDAGAGGHVAANASAATAGDVQADTDAAVESDARRGPPADLPAQVSDHVSAIHDVIDSFLTGDLEGSLGEAVSGLLEEKRSDGSER